MCLSWKECSKKRNARIFCSNLDIKLKYSINSLLKWWWLIRKTQDHFHHFNHFRLYQELLFILWSASSFSLLSFLDIDALLIQFNMCVIFIIFIFYFTHRIKYYSCQKKTRRFFFGWFLPSKSVLILPLYDFNLVFRYFL